MLQTCPTRPGPARCADRARFRFPQRRPALERKRNRKGREGGRATQGAGRLWAEAAGSRALPGTRSGASAACALPGAPELTGNRGSEAASAERDFQPLVSLQNKEQEKKEKVPVHGVLRSEKLQTSASLGVTLRPRALRTCVLRKGLRLLLLTNGERQTQREKIEACACQPYFDAIVVGGEQKEEKPAASIFHYCCDLLGVQPAECVMVGDSLDTDIQGGLNAGLKATVWLNKAMTAPVDTSPVPHYIISSVLDLPAVLQKMEHNANAKLETDHMAGSNEAH
ncbi:N-acylneuraminate-9-phosphatase [Geospiza fortis]|uniref:N-acylneuraminate-9-phosphatase n=1 Tax=Geospiza fortis TaxID=48883 RepID=A0A6I9HCR2_GEOFO|nr:N-acylneuraminate-9-phosphatase [Geospiza fortis]